MAGVLKMRTLSIVVALTLSSVALAQAKITINGRKLSARDQEIISMLEKQTGRAAIPGDYWYDNLTGALGTWGGPTVTFLTPGLGLGGQLPANASGGGQGMLTGVFINGREIHPVDAQNLAAMLGMPPSPGRWWVDAQGNCGLQGGPAMFNLYAVSRQTGSFYKNHGKGKSTYVGKGCASVNGSLGSGEDKKDYSYFVGCE